MRRYRGFFVLIHLSVSAAMTDDSSLSLSCKANVSGDQCWDVGCGWAVGCWAKWSRGVVFFVHCLSLLQPDAENQRLRHRYRARECKNAIKECEIANDYFPTSIMDQSAYIHTFIWYGYLLCGECSSFSRRFQCDLESNRPTQMLRFDNITGDSDSLLVPVISRSFGRVCSR